MKNNRKTRYDSVPLETKMKIASDMQEISNEDAFRAEAACDDELDLEELSFVTAARKPDFRSFLEKTKS